MLARTAGIDIGMKKLRYCDRKKHSSSCDYKLWSMDRAFKLDIDKVKMNQYANYLGQRSFSWKVIVRIHWQTHTEPDFSTRTTEVVGEMLTKTRGLSPRRHFWRCAVYLQWVAGRRGVTGGRRVPSAHRRWPASR